MKKALCFMIVLFFVFPEIKSAAVPLSAKSAVVINGETGEIIYELNSGVRMPMASTTKIMTAFMLCEYGNLNKEITVTKEMTQVEGSSMGLLPGDKVSLKDLLYGMMLSSGNDAANAAATVIGGSVKEFVGMMNQKAERLGLNDTHFETPSGLDGKNHYTTAKDLSVITYYAMKNRDFADAAASQYATLCYGNPPYKRILKNHNKLLNNYDGTVGVKTGFTKKAGRCLVSAARRNGKYLIAVTLNAPDDWNDHKKLLDYGFKKIKITEVVDNKIYRIACTEKGISFAECFSEKKELGISDKNNINIKIFIPRFLYLPLSENEIIGKAEVYCGSRICAEQKIYCMNNYNPEKSGKIQKIINLFIHILSFILGEV